jgi:HEPN domain-containing protein
MQPLTDEWVAKAEGDFNSAQRELRARKSPNYDASCFHCQQCAEKYLKAQLQEAGLTIPRTHDLEQLAILLTPVDATWLLLRSDLNALSIYAVAFRYPGESADRDAAKSALQLARIVRDKARMALGLP